MEHERYCQNGIVKMIQVGKRLIRSPETSRMYHSQSLEFNKWSTGKSSFVHRCHNFVKCKIISTEILLHSTFLNVEHTLQWLIFGSSWLYPEFKIFYWLNLYLFIIPVVFHYPQITKLNGCLKNASMKYKNIDGNSTKPHCTD